jgi:hypothetical protein
MKFKSDAQRKAVFSKIGNRFALTQDEKDWLKPRMYWVDTARLKGERRVKKMKPVYIDNVNKMLDDASDIYPNTMDTMRDNNVLISYDDNVGALSGRRAGILRGKADSDPDIMYVHRDTGPIDVLHEIGHINEYKAREDKGLSIPKTSWNARMAVKDIPNGREYITETDPVGLEPTAMSFEDRMKKKQAKFRDKDWAVVDSRGDVIDTEFTEEEAKNYIYGSNIDTVFDEDKGIWKKVLPSHVVDRMKLPSNELYIINVNEHPKMLKHEDIMLDVSPYDVKGEFSMMVSSMSDYPSISGDDDDD